MRIRLVIDCDMIQSFSVCFVVLSLSLSVPQTSATVIKYLRTPLFQDIVLYCDL